MMQFIIDTAPTLGALNINALAAADEVIITVNPQSVSYTHLTLPTKLEV